MRKSYVFATFVAMFALAIGASAQKSANFSGTWVLDKTLSKLGERNNIESQTLTVSQTDKDIKVSTSTKRMAPPASAPAGGGGGRMGGGGMGAGDMTASYTFDGKETTVEMDTPRGKVPVNYMGKLDGGKLMLSSSRTMNGPNGEIKMSSKETWSLSADGTTLTVESESTGMRGTTSATKVFKKKV
ncbi:MAG: hypothetical protein WKF34_08390 [Pyrinomonadaceae bacterium]